MLCSVPQSNLIGCILSWEIRGIFCLLDLFRKFLQLGILSMLSCHHDALYRYVSYVSSHQLQLAAPFHRSSQTSTGRKRDALLSLLDQEVCLHSKNGQSRRTLSGSVYSIFRQRKLVMPLQFANKLKRSIKTGHIVLYSIVLTCMVKSKST